jgi:nitroreductase
MAKPSPEQLRYILESGILAPSADNHHPLRFDVDETGVNVWYSGGDLPPAGGYKRVLVLLSLGAVSENITVAASRFGIRAELALFPAPDKPGLTVRITWRAGAADDRTLWEMIPRRHTNRNIRYRGPGLSAEERVRLEHVTGGSPACSLSWLDEPRSRRQALALMRLAEGERFRNRVQHQELFSAIRFDVGWQRSCDEGLPPGALAIEPPLRPAFALLRHWAIMRRVNLVGGYRLLGWRAADLPCRFAPHLAAITVKEADDGSVFQAGRTLQRVWLEVTRLGMALQPMAASALYTLEGARQEGVPDSLQQSLRQGWAGLLPGRHPLMLCRIGHAAPPSVTSERKSLESFWAGE